MEALRTTGELRTMKADGSQESRLGAALTTLVRAEFVDMTLCYIRQSNQTPGQYLVTIDLLPLLKRPYVN